MCAAFQSLPVSGAGSWESRIHLNQFFFIWHSSRMSDGIWNANLRCPWHRLIPLTTYLESRAFHSTQGTHEAAFYKSDAWSVQVSPLSTLIESQPSAYKTRCCAIEPQSWICKVSVSWFSAACGEGSKAVWGLVLLVLKCSVLMVT